VADLAVDAEGLSKLYKLGQRESYSTLRDVLGRAIAGPSRLLRRGREVAAPAEPNETFWALRDVSFDVRHGDVLGVIGRNGAGKSTLLKVLTRITQPTEGRVEMHGRAGSLLEVGTGFHPELTGRENVYLNGSILGMRKNEIAAKFDDIVAFSEIERFLDTPVKRYSSGMYVRLAFAVAAYMEPEILIVDEVLAVGDVAFQKKCLSKMGDAASSGTTVLLVSHNMAVIESLCSRAMLLEQGRLLHIGETAAVVEEYLSLVSTVASQDLAQRTDRQGNGRLRFTRVGFRPDDSGQLSDMAQCGRDLEFVADFTSDGDLTNVNASVAVYAPSGQCLIVLDSDMAWMMLDPVPKQGRFSCRIRRLPLAPGQYYLNLFCTAGGEIADWVQNAASFSVEAGDFFGSGKLPPAGHGGLLVEQEWACDDNDASAVEPPTVEPG